MCTEFCKLASSTHWRETGNGKGYPTVLVQTTERERDTRCATHKNGIFPLRWKCICPGFFQTVAQNSFSMDYFQSQRSTEILFARSLKWENVSETVCQTTFFFRGKTDVLEMWPLGRDTGTKRQKKRVMEIVWRMHTQHCKARNEMPSRTHELASFAPLDLRKGLITLRRVFLCRGRNFPIIFRMIYPRPSIFSFTQATARACSPQKRRLEITTLSMVQPRFRGQSCRRNGMKR